MHHHSEDRMATAAPMAGITEPAPITDLTKLLIPHRRSQDQPQRDHSVSATGVDIEVIFRNHQSHLLDLINRHPYVLGCVAWLTDLHILEALACCKGVNIVVQKEDFLRPDRPSGTDFGARLRKAYDRLRGIDSLDCGFPGIASRLPGFCYIGSVDAVRCVGNYNEDKNPAWPRMHNKFLVFCTVDTDDTGCEPILRPECVWTGSYNITFNAQKSFENSVVIHCAGVADVFAREWAQILAFSEPLDWESRWCVPEYRIGT
jgi:hypothetical protein